MVRLSALRNIFFSEPRCFPEETGSEVWSLVMLSLYGLNSIQPCCSVLGLWSVKLWGKAALHCDEIQRTTTATTWLPRPEHLQKAKTEINIRKVLFSVIWKSSHQSLRTVTPYLLNNWYRKQRLCCVYLLNTDIYQTNMKTITSSMSYTNVIAVFLSTRQVATPQRGCFGTSGQPCWQLWICLFLIDNWNDCPRCRFVFQSWMSVITDLVVKVSVIRSWQTGRPKPYDAIVPESASNLKSDPTKAQKKEVFHTRDTTRAITPSIDISRFIFRRKCLQADRRKRCFNAHNLQVSVNPLNGKLGIPDPVTEERSSGNGWLSSFFLILSSLNSN